MLLVVLGACSSAQPNGKSAAEAEAEAASTQSTADAQGAAEEPSEPAGDRAASDDEPAPTIETWFVKGDRVSCEAEGPRQCLQVRNAEGEPWRNFFGTIAGFEPEPAHVYELRVEITPLSNAPADAPSRRYRLLEVVSSRAATP